MSGLMFLSLLEFVIEVDQRCSVLPVLHGAG